MQTLFLEGAQGPSYRHIWVPWKLRKKDLNILYSWCSCKDLSNWREKCPWKIHRGTSVNNIGMQKVIKRGHKSLRYVQNREPFPRSNPQFLQKKWNFINGKTAHYFRWSEWGTEEVVSFNDQNILFRRSLWTQLDFINRKGDFSAACKIVPKCRPINEKYHSKPWIGHQELSTSSATSR